MDPTAEQSSSHGDGSKRVEQFKTQNPATATLDSYLLLELPTLDEYLSLYAPGWRGCPFSRL
jgi:hypothetical protein